MLPARCLRVVGWLALVVSRVSFGVRSLRVGVCSTKRQGIMADESTTALQEIAGLLRRRVEQHEEMADRAKETYVRSAEISRKTEERLALSEKMSQENEPRLDKYAQNAEERRLREKAERDERNQSEDVFRQRLLDELVRQNDLLERFISHLAR